MHMIDAILDRHDTQTTPTMDVVDAQSLIKVAATLQHPRGTVAWSDMVDRMIDYLEGGFNHYVPDEEQEFVDTLSNLMRGE